MRWRFVNTEAEFQKKASMQSLIEAWWESFVENQNTFTSPFDKNRNQSGLPSPPPNSAPLKAIDERLMWECSSPKTGNFLLTVTCELHIELRSLVDEIIRRAPNLPNWTFTPYREAEPPHLVEASYEARSREMMPADLTLRFERSQNNRVNLKFQSSKFNGENNVDDILTCMLISSILFGEEVHEKWIDYVLTSESNHGLKGIFSLFGGRKIKNDENTYAGWQKQLATILSEIRASRPSTLIADQLDPKDESWTVIGIKPADLPKGTPIPERISWVTKCPEVILGKSNGFHFSSENFSALGETFCSIKTKQTHGEERSEAVDNQRDEFESALNQNLRAAGLGCTFGSGIGLDNTFWDLCLTNIEQAIPIIKDLVEQHHLPSETQLVFFDSSLADETVELA